MLKHERGQQIMVRVQGLQVDHKLQAPLQVSNLLPRQGARLGRHHGQVLFIQRGLHGHASHVQHLLQLLRVISADLT